ncbi:hypothetical protein ACFLUT_03405 [Chloroflexota bacterium]
MAEIVFRMLGQEGTISVGSFVDVLQDSMRLVRELDSATSLKRTGALNWTISDLRTGSAVVSIKSRPKQADLDNSAQVVAAFVGGLSRLEREAVTPPYFSDSSLGLVQSIVRRLGSDGIAGLVVESPDTNELAEVGIDMGQLVSKLRGTRYAAQGSVEGTLETVSIHRAPRFNVYHSITLRAVRCTLPEDLVAEAGGALGRRVVVSGLVHYNAVDEPVTVDVEAMRLLPPEDHLPSIEDFIGSDPGFTGDLSTGEYIRRMRDDEL